MNKKTYFYILILIALIAGLVGIFGYKALTNKNTVSYRQSGGDKSLSDYYQEGLELSDDQNQKSTVSFLTVGDISLSRNIAQTIKTSGDTAKPFSKIESLLQSTDFNFGNLESPFGGHDRFTPSNTLTFNAPEKNIEGLVKYNFQVLNLANNHALDQGVEGIGFTKSLLDKNGILHMGLGKSLEEAWAPAIVNKSGIKIGFIGASYASINDGGKTENNYVARMEDLESLKSAISSLKPQVDFVVVTMHGGTEYTREPNKTQTSFAHSAVDFGADLVIGHHPHWIQTIEQYCPYSKHSDTFVDSDYTNCPYIFYSLGNFIFDQSWSQETKEGLALKVTLEKTGVQNNPTQPAQNMANLEDLQGARTKAKLKQIELIPILIEDNCCPREALSIEAQEILKKIGATTSIIKP